VLSVLVAQVLLDAFAKPQPFIQFLHQQQAAVGTYSGTLKTNP
jgi:hypothetical protein